MEGKRSVYSFTGNFRNAMHIDMLLNLKTSNLGLTRVVMIHWFSLRFSDQYFMKISAVDISLVEQRRIRFRPIQMIISGIFTSPAVRQLRPKSLEKKA